MKVTGIKALYPYRPDMPAVGRCAMKGPEDKSRRVLTSIECPYCHELLARIPQAGGRVIYEEGRSGVDKLAVIIDPLPDTHHAIHCRICRVTFYTPVTVTADV